MIARHELVPFDPDVQRLPEIPTSRAAELVRANILWTLEQINQPPSNPGARRKLWTVSGNSTHAVVESDPPLFSGPPERFRMEFGKLQEAVEPVVEAFGFNLDETPHFNTFGAVEEAIFTSATHPGILLVRETFHTPALGGGMRPTQQTFSIAPTPQSAK